MKNSHKDACPCCGKKGDFKKTFKLPSFLFGVSAKIHVCSGCGLGVTEPRPSTADFYEENERYEELFALREALYRRFARDLLQNLYGIIDPSGKRLIDIGCGGGFVVEEAAAMGFISEGIEANGAVVKWCRKRGLNVSQGDIHKLKKEKEYDVIVLSAVLEHLPAPAQMLELCTRILKPGGFILVSQAVYDGLLPRVFPWGWYGWQPREHYWHFKKDTLEQFFKKMGFKVVCTRSFSLYHPWFFKGKLKDITGRNLAAFIARAGNRLGMEDGFHLVLTK